MSFQPAMMSMVTSERTYTWPSGVHAALLVVLNYNLCKTKQSFLGNRIICVPNNDCIMFLYYNYHCNLLFYVAWLELLSVFG